MQWPAARRGLESDALRRAAYGNRETERREQDAEPGHQER
jgi:hypothetical protein